MGVGLNSIMLRYRFARESTVVADSLWAKSVRRGGDGDGEALYDTHPLSKPLPPPTPYQPHSVLRLSACVGIWRLVASVRAVSAVALGKYPPQRLPCKESALAASSDSGAGLKNFLILEKLYKTT